MLSESVAAFGQEALDNVMLEGDNIVGAARRAILRHDYSAVLAIFPVLRHLKINKADFDATLQVGGRHGTGRGSHGGRADSLFLFPR